MTSGTTVKNHSWPMKPLAAFATPTAMRTTENATLKTANRPNRTRT